MLGGVLTHAVLFCRVLSIFLHAVHCGIGDHAGNPNRMTDMIAELDGVALDLPSAAFRRSKIVLIGVLALLKAAESVRVFLWVVFVVSCAVASPAVLANMNNTRNVIAILNFILNLQRFDLRSEITDQKLG